MVKKILRWGLIITAIIALYVIAAWTGLIVPLLLLGGGKWYLIIGTIILLLIVGIVCVIYFYCKKFFEDRYLLTAILSIVTAILFMEAMVYGFLSLEIIAGEHASLSSAKFYSISWQAAEKYGNTCKCRLLKNYDRCGMYNDLVNNHLKKGMTEQQVIGLLGKPFYKVIYSTWYKDKNCLRYELGYCWPSVPVPNILLICFNKEMLVNDFFLTHVNDKSNKPIWDYDNEK